MSQATSQLTHRAFQIRPTHDLLLRGTAQVPAGLYQLQLLSAEQLTRLHYKAGMLNTVKARLKTLTTHGIVQSDTIPSRRLKMPYYYTLGSAGMRYLAELGYEVEKREVGQNWLFTQHTLELNDVLISALLLGKVSQYRLERFTHERVLKRTPYKAGNITLIPDAFLEFRDGTRRLPILLEHDRGTEEQAHFRRRIRAYIVLLKNKGYEQLFGTHTMSVVFTTFMGESRVEQMRAWARAELAAEPGSLWSMFCFTHLTPPLDAGEVWLGQRWLTPYDHRPAEVLLAA